MSTAAGDTSPAGQLCHVLNKAQTCLTHPLHEAFPRFKATAYRYGRTLPVGYLEDVLVTSSEPLMHSRDAQVLRARYSLGSISGVVLNRATIASV